MVSYVESWKKGTDQVQEQKLIIRLDDSNSGYEAVITSPDGEHEYNLVIEPSYRITDRSGKVSFGKKPDNTQDLSISSWNIRLFERGEKVSLLQSFYHSAGDALHLEDTLSWLAPVEDENWKRAGIFGVPILTKRVIKVAGFYCVIKVKDYQLSRTQARAFQWIELDIEFTNSWKPAIHPLTGKNRLIVSSDLERAVWLTSRAVCDKSLQPMGIPSLSEEVQKLRLGDLHQQNTPRGNIFDGHLALNKIVDRYTNKEKTIKEYLRTHKTDKAVLGSWEDAPSMRDIIFLGESYFEDSDLDRAITLIREAAHRAGVKDSDFGKITLDGMLNFNALLKEKCK